MSHFIHMIADYGTGDPYFAEVTHRLKTLDPSVEIQPTSVPAFSTIGTGFWIAQYGLYNPSFEDMAIYANTAPRKEKKYEDNRGQNLVFARLDNGIPVIAVNAGHSLSFVRHRIDELRALPIDESGSQFRSRDYFPRIVHSILEGDRGPLGQELDITRIPEPPGSCIVWIDGFGNIKTSIRHSDIDLEEGQGLALGVGGGKCEAVYRENAFAVEDDQVAFAPGSSGGEDPFMEIIRKGGPVTEYFRGPDIGDDVAYARRSEDVSDILET